jgi:hypothetical protein
VVRELGVRYVLEGSVPRAGNRVRITAQLIDAASDRHLWTDRYDRELADVFAVQNEIARTIAGELSPGIIAAEIQRNASLAGRLGPDDARPLAYPPLYSGRFGRGAASARRGDCNRSGKMRLRSAIWRSRITSTACSVGERT